jgi:hypothetical protein
MNQHYNKHFLLDYVLSQIVQIYINIITEMCEVLC